jgi:hypothetical protein
MALGRRKTKGECLGDLGRRRKVFIELLAKKPLGFK